MKKIIYILILILMASQVFGAVDSVKFLHKSVIGGQSDPNWIVGTPRDHIVALSTAGQIVVMIKDDSLKMSLDSGQTWSNTRSATWSGFLERHGHVTVHNDTIYVGVVSDGGAGEDDIGAVWIVDATSDDLTEISEQRFAVITDNTDRIYVGSSWRLPGSDSDMFAGRINGGDNDASQYVVWSTDLFQNVGTTVKIQTAAGSADSRIGGFTFNGSVGIQSFIRDKVLTHFWWNRENNDWDTLPLAFVEGADLYERNFSTVAMGDSILFTALESGDQSTLYYAWYHRDSSDWVTGVITNEAANTQGKVSLTYVEATGTMMFFYCTDPDSASYFNLVVKYIDDEDLTSISSELVLVDADTLNAYRFDTPDIIPASHGNVAYVYLNSLPGNWASSPSVHQLVTYELFPSCHEVTPDYIIDVLPFTVTTAMNGTPGNPTIIGIDCDLDGAIHSNTNGIVLNDNVHDIEFRFSTDTIYWHEDGSHLTARYFMRIRNSVYNITVDSGVIIHNIPDDSVNNNIDINANAIYAQGINPHDVTFNQTEFFLKGKNSQMFYHSGGGSNIYNFLFDNCNFDDSVVAFVRRDLWIDYAMIAVGNLNVNSDAEGFEYHFKMVRCSTFISNWVNLYVNGTEMVVHIDSNYFFMDARNDVPDAGIAGSAEQCYNIGIRTVGANRVRVAGNTFRSGTNYAGGDAIFITSTGVDTTQANSIWIYQNDIIVNKGFAGEFYTSTAVKLRQTASNIRIENNTIYTVANINDVTSYQCEYVNGIRMEELPSPANVVITGNIISTPWAQEFTPGLNKYSACIEMGGMDSTAMSGLWIRNNRLRAGHLHYQFGNDNSGPDHIEWGTFVGDTLEYITDSSYSPNIVSVWGQNEADNVILDPVFEGTADYTDVRFFGGGPNATSEVFFKKTFTLTITNTLTDPIQGVVCSVLTALGNIAVIDTTDVNGQISNPLLIYYENGAGEDSTNAELNDYTFYYNNGTTYDTLTYSIDWDTEDTTVTLGGLGVTTYITDLTGSTVNLWYLITGPDSASIDSVVIYGGEADTDTLTRLGVSTQIPADTNAISGLTVGDYYGKHAAWWTIDVTEYADSSISVHVVLPSEGAENKSTVYKGGIFKGGYYK